MDNLRTRKDHMRSSDYFSFWHNCLEVPTLKFEQVKKASKPIRGHQLVNLVYKDAIIIADSHCQDSSHCYKK